MVRATLLVAIAGCALHAPAPPNDRAASPRAPTGRLAGAPPSLRPGVVVYDDVPPLHAEPPAHHHHHGS